MEKLQDGARQGINSFHRIGYDGLCPPSGSPHRYIFTLYALDHILDLEAGASYDLLNKAMAGHVFGQAQLIGLFQVEDVKLRDSI